MIQEKFTEILGVHAAFGNICDRRAARQFQFGMFRRHIAHDLADVGQFAHAGRLDQNAIRVIGIDHLDQRFGEIAHQRTADAAGVDFRDLNAGILHETAVDADLAIFIFQQHNFFAFKSAVEQLLDQRRLACAQKTGDDIYLRHNSMPCLSVCPK